MQHLDTCLLIAEADRVLCPLILLCFNRLFALNLQYKINLLSRIFYLWLACLLGFWLRNESLDA